jgi:AcrR family transcriptional regulator
MAAAPTRRRSVDERREEIVGIAIEHFAVRGYRGTSTEVIAREAGISQAYVFRLFRTKQELFLACDVRACEKVLEVFRGAAAGAPPGEKLAAMSRAYTDELLPDRHAVLMIMQSFAAAGADPEIRRRARDTFGDLVVEVGELAGADPNEVWAFFANGMLLNVVAALELQAMAVLTHADPVSECGEQHGTQPGRGAELAEDVLGRLQHVHAPRSVGLGEARQCTHGGGVPVLAAEQPLGR